MTKELNLECPYNVFRDKDTQTYFFHTKSNIKYIAYFTDASDYFLNFHLRHNIYMFGFEPEGLSIYDKRKLSNNNIHLTIVAILESFFDSKENVLTFVADISDSKHKARNRLFESWKKEYDFENKFDKYDIEIVGDEDIYFSSMIISKDNIHRLEYKEAFTMSSEEYLK